MASVFSLVLLVLEEEQLSKKAREIRRSKGRGRRRHREREEA